jgi:hypothetical protein
MVAEDNPLLLRNVFFENVVLKCSEAAAVDVLTSAVAGKKARSSMPVHDGH